MRLAKTAWRRTRPSDTAPDLGAVAAYRCKDTPNSIQREPESLLKIGVQQALWADYGGETPFGPRASSRGGQSSGCFRSAVLGYSLHYERQSQSTQRAELCTTGRADRHQPVFSARRNVRELGIQETLRLHQEAVYR